MPIRFRFLTIVLFVTALGACAAPERNVYPDITFNHLSPINLDVLSVTTVRGYEPSYEMPNVAHEMPVLPEAVMRQWAHDRLVASEQGDARLTYTIVDANVTATSLATDETLKDWFTDEQAIRYEVSLAARIDIADPSRNASGVAEAASKRSITVPEGATLNVRNETLYDLINGAIQDLNNQLDANVREYLAMWVR